MKQFSWVAIIPLYLFLFSVANASVAFQCTSNGKIIADFRDDATCETCFDRRAAFANAMHSVNPEVVLDKCQNSLNITVHVYGKIDFDDPVIVEVIELYTRSGNVSRFKLESNGGFIHPAMVIGNFLFDNHVEAQITADCLSACSIVAAGAIRRYYGGDNYVGIHRVSTDMLPDAASSSSDSMNSYFKRSYDELTAYFERLGVGEGFVEAMKNTPNAMIRRLTLKELTNFGMGFDNVAYRDLATYRVSSKCGQEAAAKYNEIANMLSECFGDDVSPNACDGDLGSQISLTLEKAERQCLR